MNQKVANKLANRYADKHTSKTAMQIVDEYQTEQRQEFDETIFQKRKTALWNIVLFILLLCFIVSISIAFR